MTRLTMFKRIKQLLLGQRDRVRLTGRHYDNARELFLYSVDLLNRTSINYHVVYGTLLGLARERDLIPWDVDVDLMIARSDVPRFRELLWKYQLRGWRVCDYYRMEHDYAAWNRGDVSSVMVKASLLGDLIRSRTLRTGRKIMDVYVRYPDGDCEAWDTFNMVSRAPRRFFDGYETIAFAGRNVHVPCHYRDFLELVYGNWQIPNPDYDARRDDGTLVSGSRRSAA